MKIGRAHVRTPATPTSTLFPYTTLFRSRAIPARLELAEIAAALHVNLAEPLYVRHAVPARPDEDRKSTRPNSSHTDIYPLPLHDALPISCDTSAPGTCRDSGRAARESR